jgi:drug/metabolite transporter (DMT)-like permease
MHQTEPEPDNRAPSPALTLLLMGLLCLVWGSTWLVIKYGLRDVPPFTGAALRFLVAGLCMAVLVRLFSGREGGGRPPALVVITQGLFQFALNYALVYATETIIPSGLVSVLWSVFPLFIGLASHFVLKSEFLGRFQWLGLVLALSGVGLLFVTDIAKIEGRAVPMGLLMLLAPLSVTVSTLLIKHRAAGSSSLVLNRDSMLIGAAVLGSMAVLLERGAAPRFTASAIFSIAYLALAGTVLTFGVYLWLLRYVPAYRLSMISFVTPVIALLFGTVLGGEPLTLHTLLGTAFVLAGVMLVMRGKRAALPRPAEGPAKAV